MQKLGTQYIRHKLLFKVSYINPKTCLESIFIRDMNNEQILCTMKIKVKKKKINYTDKIMTF